MSEDICANCEEKIFDGRRKKQLPHTCPPFFIHKIEEKEIIIRGKDLDLMWIDDMVLIKRKFRRER